jgi:serine/threonine protein kinase
LRPRPNSFNLTGLSMDENAPANPRPPPKASGDAAERATDSQVRRAFAGVFPSGTSPRTLVRWVPPTVEELRQALPQYDISNFIASGGMGAVYKGVQKALKRTVAIKVLPPEAEQGDRTFASRFKHEAQAMARLNHANIVAVFDAGETPDGMLYFVMEYIEGTDMGQVIASEGRLDPQRAVKIITAVCDALAFAHEEGIIHRDIKPSNIMLDKKGRVKVADFGLAKAVHSDTTMLTGTGMRMGTPQFMAPEAFSGAAVDHRVDLYSLGVMLYQMLTGRIPRGRFVMPTSIVPQIDPRFDAIVDKAMQAERDQRYSTVAEIKTELEKITELGPAGRKSHSRLRLPTAPASVDSASPPVRAPRRVSRKAIIVAFIVLVLIVAGAFLFLRK